MPQDEERERWWEAAAEQLCEPNRSLSVSRKSCFRGRVQELAPPVLRPRSENTSSNGAYALKIRTTNEVPIRSPMRHVLGA